MQDKYVKCCPFCGGMDTIKCHQTGYTVVTAVDNLWASLWGGPTLYHSICRKCGSVVRSYVKEPEKLLRRKDRK